MAGRSPRSAEQKDFDARMGRRLKQLRKDMPGNLQPHTLAERIGVTVDAYNKWEQRGPIPPYYLYKLCLELGHHPWMLLTGQPDFLDSLEQHRRERIIPLKPRRNKKD